MPNVPTFRCFDERDRKHVISDMSKLVVKPANESGGYGVLVGDRASSAQLSEYARLILTNPREYVAQPIVRLSTAPTLCDDAVEPRHLDLPPFTLQGTSTYVTRGGLTRVALRRDSLVVNSSQGGGSKDTWVVDTDAFGDAGGRHVAL